jgi:hypothetical protein
MFDFITRRRLIFCFFGFLIVIISILFFTHLNSTVIGRVVPLFHQSSSSNVSIDKDQPASTCYVTEPVEILSSCQKCTSYDHRSEAVGCSTSGYKEFILCTNTKTQTYRSCPVPPHIQKQHFWLFEGVIFLVGILALVSVQSRQKTLDKQMVEKIKKQIGDSDE